MGRDVLNLLASPPHEIAFRGNYAQHAHHVALRAHLLLETHCIAMETNTCLGHKNMPKKACHLPITHDTGEESDGAHNPYPQSRGQSNIRTLHSNLRILDVNTVCGNNFLPLSPEAKTFFGPNLVYTQSRVKLEIGPRYFR